jgi:hypothetical protein
MSWRGNEAVAIGPAGMFWTMPQKPDPQDISHGRCPERQSGVANSLAIYHDAAIMVSHKSWSRAGSSMSLPPLWYSRSIATKSILLHNRTDL